MNQAIRSILEAAYRAQSGHVPSALSILDILTVLYRDVMAPEDQFILSKGHGALALYHVLGRLEEFAERKLADHPEAGNGIEFSTGSLGHGLALAAGLGLAKKIRNEGGRVFCLVGDGECQEGATWEAARIIVDRRLPVVCVVDANGTHEQYYRLRQVFAAWGWLHIEIDGHDADRIAAIKMLSVPAVVIARTVKGHGVPEMEADPEAWHHRAMSEAEYRRLAA